MSQATEFGVKQIVLAKTPFGPREVQELVQALTADQANYRQLYEAVQEFETKQEMTPAAKARLGICYYLLGRFRQAVDTLASADGSAMALFYLAKGYIARENAQAAIDSFKAAAQAGYNSDDCALGTAEALRKLGRTQDALAALDRLSGAVEQTAEYLYQRGATVAAIGDSPSEVIALYERAVDADPRHPGALFGLALENERHGNDDSAMDLYQRATGRVPAHVGSLLNLGILYEDRQQYERARQCYQRILDAFPTDARARLFMRDTQASSDMYYDEEAARRRDRLGQLLNIPVTDFELSVRSRNCLQKMGVMTLGDLTRCTEQELLASKNFGETSLTEIKDMLSSKGLQLGQFVHERMPEEQGFEPEAMSADEQAMLGRPIAELNLSVRARKCMARLGIATIGELVRRTGDELLEVKNFGVTSLNEVREKLTQHGIKLRGE